MTDPQRSDSVAPPLLEQLGALCSLLIHDLANQLCIISGSATFAQMVLDDPERIAHSLKAIVQAGDNAGHALGSCGELRRALPETVPPSELQDVMAQLRALTERQPGWSLEAEEGLQGAVRLPAVWASFAVQCLIKELHVTAGSIGVCRIRQVAELYDQADSGMAPPDQVFLRIAIRYSADQMFEIRKIRGRYDHLGLLAAFELNRCLGGRIDSRSLEPGRQEVWLDLSFVPTDS